MATIIKSGTIDHRASFCIHIHTRVFIFKSHSRPFHPSLSAHILFTLPRYLQLSLAGQLTVFSARTRKFFFSRRPGTPLLIAFCVAQALSTLIAIYPLGPLEPMIGMVRGKECMNDIYE